MGRTWSSIVALMHRFLGLAGRREMAARAAVARRMSAVVWAAVVCLALAAEPEVLAESAEQVVSARSMLLAVPVAASLLAPWDTTQRP